MDSFVSFTLLILLLLLWKNFDFIFFRRTKSLSPSRIDQLKQILQDMGADVDKVKPTKQDC